MTLFTLQHYKGLISTEYRLCLAATLIDDNFFVLYACEQWKIFGRFFCFFNFTGLISLKAISFVSIMTTFQLSLKK